MLTLVFAIGILAICIEFLYITLVPSSRSKIKTLIRSLKFYTSDDTSVALLISLGDNLTRKEFTSYEKSIGNAIEYVDAIHDSVGLSPCNIHTKVDSLVDRNYVVLVYMLHLSTKYAECAIMEASLYMYITVTGDGYISFKFRYNAAQPLNISWKIPLTDHLQFKYVLDKTTILESALDEIVPKLYLDNKHEYTIVTNNAVSTFNHVDLLKSIQSKFNNGIYWVCTG